MKKNWKVAEKYPQSIAKGIEADDLTRQLLFNRGITNKEDTERFFYPDYNRDSHDPFLIENMEKAVERILYAINKKEKILVFGDYDADGVCGSVVFSDFFKFINHENIQLYNPDRYKEGYGLSEKALEALFEMAPKLLITVDCGISNNKTIEEAQKKGIDVIVVDHHLPPETLPPAHTIIDPYQKGNTYPFPFLCGTGLAFKTVQALFKKGNFLLKEGYEKWILDIVAIATVADMVPLRDENRMFVYWGIEVLKKNRRLGLKELMSQSRVTASGLSTDDIGYTLGPLINSAGRLDHANTAVELLRASTPDEAQWLSSRLTDNNVKRRAMVNDIVKKASDFFSNKSLPDIIILSDESWHPGVLGIAANRLVEMYARPAFIAGKGESDHLKGSARSDGSVNLVDLMKRAGEDLFVDFGGHSMAAGFTIVHGRESEFAERIREAYERMPKGENIFEDVLIDKELSIDDVEWNTLALLGRFEPFGEGNPKPAFLFKNISLAGTRAFGNGDAHLELQLRKSSGEIVKAIGFGMKDNDGVLKKDTRIDLVASLEHSTFRGYNELRLRIVDYRIV